VSYLVFSSLRELLASVDEAAKLSLSTARGMERPAWTRTDYVDPSFQDYLRNG
jgi:hypothetical protein